MRTLLGGAIAFVFAIAFVLFNPGPAQAQEAATGAASAQQAQPQRRAIDTVVTTARKREETTQSVPIAVSSFDGNFLETRFETDLADLDKYAPNVDLGPLDFTGAGIAASIRGISLSDLEKTFEPAVGISVDGVFLGSNAGALIDMFDIESVEILRGPQGTLFGRNTIGGVINITRTQPTGEFGIKLGARFGSDDRRDFRVVMNFPIIENVLAGKVAAFFNSDDTFTRNVFTGEDQKGQDVSYVYGTLYFTPSDTFDATLTLGYYDDDSIYEGPIDLTLDELQLRLDASGGMDQSGRVTFCTLFGAIPTVTGGGVGCADASLEFAQENGFDSSFNPPNIPFKSFVDWFEATLEMNWDVGDYTITSVTGYRDQNELLDEENTGSPFAGVPFIPFSDQTGVARAVRDQTFEQFTQELRVASNYGGKFDFVAGAYFFYSSYFLDPQVFGSGGALAQKFAAGQDSYAYALFAEGNYNLTDRLRFTLGGRFTWEEKDFETTVFNVPMGTPFDFPAVLTQEFAPLFEFEGSESWSEPTWRAGLDYQVTDQAMVYFTYSRGFRSGGWNGRCVSVSACENAYDPETVDNFEIGLKSDWFDNRLRLNIAAFIMKYDNKQESVIRAAGSGGTETVVENASSVDISGVELEFQGLPADWLNVYGSVGYLHTEFNEFLQADPNDPDTLIDISDIANVRLAPEWTFNIGGDVYFPVGNGGEITFNANLKWTDEVASSPFVDPVADITGMRRDIIDDYAQADFSVSYRGPLPVGNVGGDYRITFFLKDAFHDDGRVVRSVDAGFFWFGTQAPGRTWGVEIDAEF